MEVVSFDEDGARRVIEAVKAWERGAFFSGASQQSRSHTGQLRPFYISVGSNENGPLGFPVDEIDGFDWTALDATCGDGVELVDASSSIQAENPFVLKKAFFEGSVFADELAQVCDFGNSKYLFGGSHLGVTGALDTSAMTITLDGCGDNAVSCQYLTQPAEAPANGSSAVAVYCRNIRKYVIVAYDPCEDA